MTLCAASCLSAPKEDAGLASAVAPSRWREEQFSNPTGTTGSESQPSRRCGQTPRIRCWDKLSYRPPARRGNDHHSPSVRCRTPQSVTLARSSEANELLFACHEFVFLLTELGQRSRFHLNERRAKKLQALWKTSSRRCSEAMMLPASVVQSQPNRTRSTREQPSSMQPTAPEPSQSADYGLRRGILSPMETLAQSVSTMAPTTTPAATIPLVCALAGNGTWLAYVLATAAIFLVGLCIARYARHSASPGSLYTYASMTLPRWLSATVAWSLLLAYVATGSSVIGGFYYYANLLIHDATGHVFSAALLSLLVTGVSIWIAYRDVKISARLMLWIEAASVSVIVIVVVLVLLSSRLAPGRR